MVLRKRAPPHLYSLSQGNDRSESRSPTSQISPTAKSASAPSPKRLTRPRRAQSSPHPRRLPSQESIYSPDLNTSPAFDLMPLEQAQRSPTRSSPNDIMNPWADELVEGPNQTPQGHDGPRPSTTDNPPLGGDSDNRKGDRVPPIVVAGTQRRMAANEWQQNAGDDAPDWEHVGYSPVQLQSNNPFLRPQQNPWDDKNPRPFSEATSASHDSANARLGQDEGYIPMTARLSLFDQQSESPWTEERSSPAAHLHTLPEDQRPSQDRSTSDLAPYQAADAAYAPYQQLQPAPQNSYHTHAPPQSQQGDHRRLSQGNVAGTSVTSTSATESSHVLVDLNESPYTQVPRDLSRGASSVYSDFNSNEKALHLNDQPVTAPPLPERPDLSQSSQPISGTPVSEAEARKQSEQRSETYSIRHVNWTDATGRLRDCPILAQNKNGPCPLLALVNALVLRSSADAQPPIVRALQTREQISLGLLIAALFDELTTCLGPDDELPDIEALSRFLTMLHTGMNVNPRLTLESNDSVGAFLETEDIKFYGTFGVPLLHGWVAEPSTEAEGAFARVAQYHEDIQLLPFRRQELEDRVFRGGSLTPEEEQTTKDMQTIQHFTDIENATQLSTFGLRHLTEKLSPGSLSILFRNDHFSTLYKHPQNHQLFTLVTDAGYAGRAEIVWESLVDVNGSNTGFFAGDFRPVGHTPAADPSGPRTSSNAASSGVASSTVHEQPGRTLSPQEQADADYAYALSLQLQEDEQRANDGVDRNRNQRASVPYYPQGHASGPPPTRHRSTGHRPSRHNADDLPPPSYEQAARGRMNQASQRQPISGDSPFMNPYQRNQVGRRPGGPVTTGPADRAKDRAKDCIVM